MYKRILLKLSGEALKEKTGSHTIDVECLQGLAHTVVELHNMGVEIAIVIGAGNIWRGKLASKLKIEPVQADFMGMLGTVINCVAMASSVKNLGVDSEVFSAVSPIEGVCKLYNIEDADKALSQGKVVCLAGGTGKPFFTTDTASTLRAIELNCEAILMGKNGVDGVYTSDPLTDPNAEFIKFITFDELEKKHLQVMDQTAVELIKDKDIDIRVFSMADPSNFIKVANGEDIGTTCSRKAK